MTTDLDIELDLHPKQGDALLSPATEILYGGAAGGGKSHLLRVAVITWCIAIAGLQVYFFRRIYPDLYANHMKGVSSFPAILAPWVKSRLVKINWADGEIKFWTGSSIYLRHCKSPTDVYNYTGYEMNVLVVDELTQWLQEMYEYLRTRVRIGALVIPDEYQDLFPRIICSTNPGQIGHNWVKKEFVETCGFDGKIVKMPKKDGGMNRQFIQALLEDNPTLTENDPGYEDRLASLGNPALAKALRWGEWEIVVGGMFDDVWDRNTHVIDPFDIPFNWTVDRSFDWGSSKPFSVGWWAESNGEAVTLRDGSQKTWPRGTVFRIKEWYGCHPDKRNKGIKMIPEEIAEGIKEMEKSDPILKNLEVVPGPADASIFDDSTGISIGQRMENHDVEWVASYKGRGSRSTGWLEIRKRLLEGLKVNMEEPGLFIFKGCDYFVKTVSTLQRKKSDPDDVDTEAEDHIGDETRYRLTYTHEVVVA